MTVATVRAAIRTAVSAVSGVRNVDVEEPYGKNEDGAAARRMDAGRPHFWLVKVNTLRVGGGAGYNEFWRTVRVQGFLGIDPEAPDGLSSYVRAADLEAAVVAALVPSALSLDVEAVAPDGEIPEVSVQIGDVPYLCHRVGITATIIEVT